MKANKFSKRFLLKPVIAVTIASGLASYARAADTNPYVLLYEARAASARAEVDRSRANNEFHRQVYERDRYLYARNAVSLEELQKAQSEYEAGLSETGALNAKVNEADAMVAIVKLRVASGESIPICTSGG